MTTFQTRPQDIVDAIQAVLRAKYPRLLDAPKTSGVYWQKYDRQFYVLAYAIKRMRLNALVRWSRREIVTEPATGKESRIYVSVTCENNKAFHVIGRIDGVEAYNMTWRVGKYHNPSVGVLASEGAAMALAFDSIRAKVMTS